MNILNSFRSTKAKFSDAEKIVKQIYFGFLHRQPEATTLHMLATKISRGMPLSPIIEGILKSAEFRQNLPIDRVEDYLKLTVENTPRKAAHLFQFIRDQKQKKIRNIIYFCPAISWPTGGIKVIIRHSEIIKNLNIESVTSEVYFPELPDFELSWFDHQAKIKRDPTIDIHQDFIVLPEVYALNYGPALIEAQVRYAIYVQNGYYLFSDLLQGNDAELLKLKEIYQKSDYILSVSKDTSDCINLAFNIDSEKILVINPSINEKIFTYNNTIKSNIVTYMPRKLQSHSSYIITQLRLRNKNNWQFIPIEGASETEVAHLLTLSKIFFSFSDREGFSLPPLEAALCGNSVVGYTGEGAKEYWREPIFKKIENGNLIEFIKVAEEEMEKLTHNSYPEEYAQLKSLATSQLAQKYSLEQEIEKLGNFVAKVISPAKH